MALDASLGENHIIPSFRAMIDGLREQGFHPGRLRDTLEAENRPDVMLRHDVDHRLDSALKFAELEAELGLHSTYYLLPPGDYKKNRNYYGRLFLGRVWHTSALKKAVQTLTSMGHEVGLHTDLVQMSIRSGRPPQDFLGEELAWLRKVGADVIGTAAHGSSFARNHDFANYEIFSGLTRLGKPSGRLIESAGRSVKLNAILMQDYGLRYEAYHLSRGVSLSDSGGKLRLLQPDKHSFDETELQGHFLETFITSCTKFRAKPVNILFHPEWWHFTG